MDGIKLIAFRFTTLVLPVILLLLCVWFLLSRRLYCDNDAVLMTRLLRNVTANNKVDWDQFGEKLGFTHDMVISTADIDLVETWINNLYDNGPASRKKSIVKLLLQEGYIAEERTIQMFKGFEKCASELYWLSVTLMFSIIVLLIWSMFGFILLFHCTRYIEVRRYGHSLRSIQKARRRLRTSSTRTCDDEQAEISHSTFHNKACEENRGWKQMFIGIITPCSVFNDNPLSDDDPESPDIDEPETNVKGNRFHRTYDTTLQESSIKQILDAMKSVGLLFNKNGALGSVVRVGSKYVITAWHVVERIVHPSTHNFNKQPMNVKLLSASDVYIDFNEYCRQSPKETHFKICPKIVFVDCQWDIVILEICGKAELPEPVRSFSDVSSLNTTRNDVTCVHVIGQHPKKEIVVADMSCKIINRNDKRVKKAIKWTKKHTTQLKQDLVTWKENPNMVSTAYFDVNDTMHRLIFDTFLEFGGSGGAVLTFTPEGDLALVAILTHGLPPFRSFYTSEIPDSNTMEVGTTLNAIKDSQEWKPGMEKIKEDVFQMHAAMETDGQIEEMETDDRL